MADYSNLKQKAQEIRDEVKIGGNTAYRVGKELVDIIDELQKLDDEKADKQEVVKYEDIAQNIGDSENEVMSQAAVTRELSGLESKNVFVTGCHFIKELYINEAGKAAGLNRLHSVRADERGYFLAFSGTEATSFLGYTNLNHLSIEAASGIQPITNNGSVNGTLLGYVIVDWTNVGEIDPVQLINDNCYDVSYSPSIKSMLQSSLFAERCPFIKELYLTQDGINAGVKTVHNIMPGDKYGVMFSDATMTTYVAQTDTFDTKEEAYGIMVIKPTSGSTILGYIIIDWNLLDMSNIPQVCPLTDITKDINYSPAIKAYIESSKIKENIDNIQENVINIENIKTAILGEEDGEKDFSLLTGFIDDSFSLVYFQYPKEKQLSKITEITYKARIGLSNFYVVTVNGTTATLELIATYTNNGSQGDIITIPIETITLGDNQYIGINGNFYFGIDEYSQGFTGSNVNISTLEVAGEGIIALGLVPKNNNSLSKEIKELESFDTTKEYGDAIGETLNIPAYEVVLAADGSGDYTNWTDAHTACREYPYNTRMIIKPGIYDLPVLGGGTPGYDIQYDIIGIGNPILKCVNSSADVDIKKTFAPFMMDYSAASNHRTTRIEGITLIGEDVRYCVHDEMGGLLAVSYTHIFKNCCFIHKTAPDSDWDKPRCIGGGLGHKGLIIIDNCEFRSVIETSVDYHGGFDGGQQSSKVIISNCTLTNNTVSATTISLPSEKSVMVVRGCILGSAPICTDYNGRVDVEIKQEGNIIV